MSDKLWTVELDGASHQIVWRYGRLFARNRLSLDGQALDSLWAAPHPLRADATGYAAEFDKHLIAVFVYPSRGWTHHELFIDGRSTDTGKSMFEDVPPHYVVLGVSVYAEAQQIQQSYRQWQERFDDPRAQASPEVIERIANIREQVEAAYAVLGDPKLRLEYDMHYPHIAKVRRRKTVMLWFVIASGILLFCVVSAFALLVMLGNV